MPDEQIERVLAEARRGFAVSELMRPFYTYQRLFQRVAPQMEPEECAAALLVLNSPWTDSRQRVIWRSPL